MEDNLIMIRKNGFQNLLYTRFVIEKKYRVDETAEKMGIHRDTLYKWVRGENQFPIDYLPALVIATGDEFFIRYLAREAGYAINKKCKDKAMNKTLNFISEILSNCMDRENEGPSP